MILTVTLNPAMDRLLFVNGFIFNVTNRISRREDCVGGKGTHVSVNLADLGEASIATGIAMGETGKTILETLERSDVTCDFVYSQTGESRTNYLLLDERTSTLICEKGPAVSGELLDAFSAHYGALLEKTDCVVISGDASNFLTGAGVSLQESLLKSAREKGVKIVLDCSGAALFAGVQHGPFLIKPNAEELSELTKLATDTEEEIVRAIKSLSPHGIEIVAVSMGKKGSIVKYYDEYYRCGIAELKPVNTIGCGDAYLSGMIYAIRHAFEPIRVMQFAAACGSAEALNPLSVGLDRMVVESLCDTILVEKMENE